MANALNKVNSGGIEDGSIVNADIKSDAAIAGSKLADNAVGLAQMASGTDGQIITYDASGDPIAVGPGTDGQVLTSTGAGSPPAFEDAAGGTALTGSTNNTITTVTGANAIQGEANLTFDGSHLQLSNASQQTDSVGNLQIRYTGSDGTLNSGLTTKSYSGTSQFMQWSTGGLRIGSRIITNSGLGNIYFTAGNDSVKAELGADGHLLINDGDLKIGAAGHGIDFSANSPAGGMASELFDHYEEGTFTAAYYYADGTHMGDADGRYTRIGNTVRVSVFEFAGAAASTTDKDMSWIQGFPFNCRSEPNSVGTIVRYGGGNNATISASEACYLAQGGTRIKFDNTFNTGSGNWTVSLVYEV